MTIFPALVKTYEQCSKPPVGLLDGVINCPVYIGDSHNPWKIIQKPMVSPPLVIKHITKLSFKKTVSPPFWQ